MPPSSPSARACCPIQPSAAAFTWSATARAPRISAGVNVWATITLGYAFTGLFTALAGVLLAAHYQMADMQYGTGYDYQAIAAVLVGGTPIAGGQGSVVRTLIGVLVVAVVQSILLLQGWRPEWQYLITGVIVLAVIILHMNLHKR